MSEESPFGIDPDSRELWWLTQTEPLELFALLDPQACPRKWWLFIAACLKGVEGKMPGPASRSAIHLAEECSHGRHHTTQMVAAQNAIATERTGAGHNREYKSASDAAHWTVVRTGSLFEKAVTVAANASSALDKCTSSDRHLEVVRWLRDVFGNPFRPVPFAPSWRTGTAVSLARTMYESREFGAMPILADALQDAGCDSPAVLDHCRDAPLAHVRGCWVVDLVLCLQ